MNYLSCSGVFYYMSASISFEHMQEKKLFSYFCASAIPDNFGGGTEVLEKKKSLTFYVLQCVIARQRKIKITWKWSWRNKLDFLAYLLHMRFNALTAGESNRDKNSQENRPPLF